MQTLIKSYELVSTKKRFLEVVEELNNYLQANGEAFLGLDVETRHCLLKRYEKEIPRPVRTKKGLRGKATTIQIGQDPSIKDRQYVINVMHLYRDGMTDEEIGDYLRPILTKAKILGHNLLYEYQFMRAQFGIKMPWQNLKCLYLFSKVLMSGDDDVKHGLSDCYEEYFGRELFGWFKDITGMNYQEFADFKGEMQTSDWSLEELSDDQIKYAAHDVGPLVFSLWTKMKERLDQFSMDWARQLKGKSIANVIRDEWAAIPTYAMIELRGWKVDFEHQRKTIALLEEKKVKSEQEVAKYFTRTVTKSNGLRGKARKVWEEIVCINLGSPKQVKESIQKVLGETIPNTEAETLERYADRHPAIYWILQYKKASHNLNNFGQKLLDLCEDTERIHSNILQNGTETGRATSNNQNLKQIPAHDVLFKDEENPEGYSANKLFRGSFVADEGHKLVVADYSQIEPRLASAMTGDLVKEFRENQELDLHAATGKDMLGLVELPKKGDPNRDVVGKQCNLGLGYRMGFKLLAQNILEASAALVRAGKMERVIDWTKNDYEEAKKRLAKYWESRPGTKRKMDEFDREMTKLAEAAGTLAVFKGRKPICVAFSMLGRPRRFCLDPRWEDEPDCELRKSDWGEWGKYEQRIHGIKKKGWNHPVQGTAADLFKRALVRIDREMEEKGFDVDGKEGILGEVYDEVIAQCREERAEELAEIIERNMREAAYEFTKPVPAIVKYAICERWCDGK